MVSSESLMEFYKTVFVLSDRLQPSEIDNMTMIDLKIFIMLYNSWVEEKNNGNS
jgi:hypothetical protein